MHIYSDVSSIIISGAYSQVNVDRLAAWQPNSELRGAAVVPKRAATASCTLRALFKIGPWDSILKLLVPGDQWPMWAKPPPCPTHLNDVFRSVTSSKTVAPLLWKRKWQAMNFLFPEPVLQFRGYNAPMSRMTICLCKLTSNVFLEPTHYVSAVLQYNIISCYSAACLLCSNGWWSLL